MHKRVGWTVTFMLAMATGSAALTPAFGQNGPSLQQSFFAPGGLAAERTLTAGSFMRASPGQQIAFVSGVVDGMALAGDEAVLRCLSAEPFGITPNGVLQQVRTKLANRFDARDMPVAHFIAEVFLETCQASSK